MASEGTGGIAEVSAVEAEVKKEEVDIVQARIESLEKQVESLNETVKSIPGLMSKAFEQYDTRVRAMIPQQGSGSTGGFIGDIASIASKFIGPQAAGQVTEINDLSNAIVRIVLRNTLRNVDKALGGAGHVTLEGK